MKLLLPKIKYVGRRTFKVSYADIIRDCFRRYCTKEK